MGTSGISSGFPLLSRSSGQVAHVLLTRSPLGLHQGLPLGWTSFDLHVLSTPPAFVLSQDQTLHRDHAPSKPGSDPLKSRRHGLSSDRPTGTKTDKRLLLSVVLSALTTAIDAKRPSPALALASSVPFSKSASPAGTRRRHDVGTGYRLWPGSGAVALPRQSRLRGRKTAFGAATYRIAWVNSCQPRVRARHRTT